MSQYKYFYETAQICEGAHIRNTTVESHPECNEKYCSICNLRVISTCQFCGTPIRGDYFRSFNQQSTYGSSKNIHKTIKTINEKLTKNYVVPAYCHECGKPYPWTQAILLEGEGIIDILDDLTLDQKEQLKSFIPDLLVEKPGNRLAALKMSIIINACKAGGKNLFIDFLKEHIIQSLFVLMHLK